MIVAVSIGDCQATVDTEGQAVTAEHALDLLNRCADAALRVYAGLPDTTD
jgi:hypothetical protein